MHNKMKKYIFIIVFILVFFIMLKYSEEISTLKSHIYSQMHAAQISTGNTADPQIAKALASVGIDPYVSAADLSPVSRNGTEWFINAPLIYHACGGIRGIDYTNSREALLSCLSENAHFIEVDFSFTSDGRLVCMHDWDNSSFDNEIPNYHDFMSSLIYGKYTPLSAEDIISYMSENPELYIIIDTKDSLPEVMNNVVSLTSDASVLNRLIIQIYYPGEKEKISNIYQFPDDNYLLTLYKLPGLILSAEQILGICYKENINVITAPYSYFSEDDINLINSKNFVIYEHTINRPDIAKAQLAKGIHGLYTDFLYIDDIS